MYLTGHSNAGITITTGNRKQCGVLDFGKQIPKNLLFQAISKASFAQA